MNSSGTTVPVFVGLLESTTIFPFVYRGTYPPTPRGVMIWEATTNDHSLPLVEIRRSLNAQSPKPPVSWNDIRNATSDAAICIQRSIFARQEDISGSEDCLYLNVYTQKIPGSEYTTTNLPVMVWFHGGGWVSGAGTSKFYGPTFLMDQDIVLVTVNYRLGPLGFLSTGDEASPGNYGLKDQVAALRWTRDNIAAFGGNPNSVTIFGESAGGASVHYHMLSPLSNGLFHRGISQSGTALNIWTLAPNGDSKFQAEKLATFLSCPKEPTAALVKCLREKSAVDIIATDRQFMEWDVDPLIPFKPVIEKRAADGEEIFLPDHPLHLLLNRSKLLNTSWITGLNSGEGGLRAAPIFANQELVAELNHRFNEIAPISMFYGQTSPKVDEVSQRIRNFYFGNEAIDSETVYSAVDMFTDNWFLHGANQAVKLQAAISNAPVYYYYFTYRGTKSFSELFSGINTDFGVCHADELQYLFPSNRVFPDLVPSEEDNKIADILITTWTNFARTGKPSAEEVNVPVEWKPVTPSALEYLHIGSEIFMSRDLLKERAEFWASLPINKHQIYAHFAKDEL
ncbi:hypothetical protein PR048_027904 [Dryococelus australis]|uniref:Carboxylic ester hydrolase n=1 Tax=Dryococelus australis TaxID=614101 RepID=A0ABQ9GHT6_9NEOP|nr:hypothetical protein PR048_027904 [Dryococelus australis]